ncbi:MAG: redox-regulated ATPase YchF [Mycoplasmoidaceae bacterium]
MSLSTGIIGLPNIGKSTLFSAITNSKVEIANYAFATINPNTGIINFRDKRINELANIINPDKITYVSCKFVDIAGLVKGASKGEGLGNKFLQNIREIDCICHVVRCFNDLQITHVSNSVDPITDVTIINLELIYADLEVINSRLNKITNKVNSGDEKLRIEYNLFLKLKDCLEKELMLSTLKLQEEELLIIKNYSFLTMKPMFYIANIDDSDVSSPDNNNYYNILSKHVGLESIIPISIKIEHELSLLDDETKELFLKGLNIEKNGLDHLIEITYRKLGLETFFTFGKTEVRGWTFKKGMTAKECAGIIHSDFSRGFIKAEIIKYEDLLEIKDEQKLKETGKVKLVGRDYIIKDGDICHFYFNV